MKATLKKITVLSLALLLSLSAVAFAGCSGLPQDEIDSIIAGAASAQYDSFGFDMDAPMSVDVCGGDDPGTMLISMSGSGVTDIVNEKVRMSMDLNIDLSGGVEQTAAADIYIVDGWMYSGFSVPDAGEEWQKMELTEEMWQQQDMVGQNLELLATAFEVNYKGTETVSGVECYVFEIEPDLDLLNAVLSQQATGLDILELSELDFGMFYKDLTVKQWLAKDSYHLMRVEIELVMEMAPDDFGATSEDFDEMTVEVGMTMRFYDYNQSFTIELPEAALEAEDVAAGFTTEQTAPQE